MTILWAHSKVSYTIAECEQSVFCTAPTRSNLLSWRNPRWPGVLILFATGTALRNWENVTSFCLCARFVPDATLKKHSFRSLSFQVIFSRVFGCFGTCHFFFSFAFSGPSWDVQTHWSTTKRLQKYSYLTFSWISFLFNRAVGNIDPAGFLLDLKFSSWSIMMRNLQTTFRSMGRSLC